jgi:hypothetical protein
MSLTGLDPTFHLAQRNRQGFSSLLTPIHRSIRRRRQITLHPPLNSFFQHNILSLRLRMKTETTCGWDGGTTKVRAPFVGGAELSTQYLGSRVVRYVLWRATATRATAVSEQEKAVRDPRHPRDWLVWKRS